MRTNIIILAAIALLSAGFTSCNQKIKEKNVTLKTEIDSLSYFYGLENAEDFKRSRGYDPEIVNADWVDGFLSGVYSEKLNENFIAGQQAGINYKKWLDELSQQPLVADDSTAKINIDAFVDAMVNNLLDKKDGKMTVEDARTFANSFFERMSRRINADAIEIENEFLAENRTREGVRETPSGLQYRIIRQGKGEIPGENTKVSVHYIGTFLDGTEFDNSIESGEPFEFNTSGGVIPAWQEAVKMMPVGSKWVIYVPSSLAYGHTGYRDPYTGSDIIPPFTPLVFEIELLEILK